MPKSNSSDSESEYNDSDSSSEERKGASYDGKEMEVPEYEKQRLKRIEENRARMEALGLHKMASSFMESLPNNNSNNDKKMEKKGKRKLKEEDEEYRPEGEEEEVGLSEEEDEEEDNKSGGDSSRVSKKKALKLKSGGKKNNLEQKGKKKILEQKGSNDKDYVDDEDALMKAISLSLQDCAGFLNVSDTVTIDCNTTDEQKGNAGVEDSTTKRKRKKPISSRVQMTEDEVIVHFFQFDEAGKGNINLGDLRRIAAGHDFTWSDTEMANMISFFDSGGDGKLNLEDFRKIVSRCNMLQES